MTNCGILCNPASGRLKGRLHEIKRSLNTIPDSSYCEAVSSTEINQSIRRFADSRINLFIIVGGDGTVHTSFTHLFHIWKGKLPVVAVIPGGTTNMTALDLGMKRSPIESISLLGSAIADPEPTKYTLRRVLRIEQGEILKLFGMFFGCGLIPHGVKFFHNNIRGLGVTNEFAGGFVMIKYLPGFLFRPGNLPATHLTLLMEGRTVERHDCLAAFATTLDRLLLGVRPYRNLKTDSLFFTAINNNMKSVWSSVISLLAGNGGGSGDIQAGSMDRLEFLFDGDFIVDGEMYHARRQDGPVSITRTEPITFLVV